jgi:hypothetical protein
MRVPEALRALLIETDGWYDRAALSRGATRSHHRDTHRRRICVEVRKCVVVAPAG